MKKIEMIELIYEMRDFIETEKDAHDIEYGTEYSHKYAEIISKATDVIIRFTRDKQEKNKKPIMGVEGPYGG